MNKTTSNHPDHDFVAQTQAPPSYEEAVGTLSNENQTNSVSSIRAAPTRHVITQVIVTQVGPHSTHMSCPSCHADIKTITKNTPGSVAWVSGFLIALFG